MADRAVPMIHVPDVRATVAWYESIGFDVINTYGNESDGLSFAIMSFGNSQVMFNEGGQPSTSFRREVDLYVYTDQVDELYNRLKDQVDIVESPHDTFYGMHELIIRDLNRFWLTFGQASAFSVLMHGVRTGDAELVRTALKRPDLKSETLNAALAAAVTDKKEEIAEILKQAGALPSAQVGEATLRSYVGQYKGDSGFEINVAFRDGRLFAAPGAQEPLSLLAIDELTFRPIDFDDYGTLVFVVEEGKTVGCLLKHGSHEMKLNLVD